MAKKQKNIIYLATIPGGAPYVKKVLVNNTKYTQDKIGRFTGRKRVPSPSRADKIIRGRVAKPFTLVRGSNNARGYLRKNRRGERQTFYSGEFI